MRISSPLRGLRLSFRKRETVLLFSVGSFRFAIGATAVDEIREVNGIEEFASRLPKVEHTLLRQEKRYFVVDAAKHFRVAAASASRLMLLRGFPVAVMVNAIEGMQEIHSIQSLPEAFRGEERNWYRGVTILNDKVVPIVRPEAFLTKAELTLLRAALQAKSMRAVAVTA